MVSSRGLGDVYKRQRMHYGTKGGGQGTSYRNISEGLGSLTYVW